MDETTHANSRERVLALFRGERVPSKPCFSGLINITAVGLQARGLRMSEIHTDARKMAAAAATSYELFGLESAVVPTDLCVEASALGAEVDFREDVEEPMFPIISRPLAGSAEEFRLDRIPDITGHPRVIAVRHAIGLLKQDVGRSVVIGAWLPGPLTLAMHVVDLSNLLMDVIRAPDAVSRVLDELTEVLIPVAQAYRAAGADFLTIHEMGGSPGVVGPAAFRQLVLPRLRRLVAALPPPRVLSVCGSTNRALPLLAEAGADALSVDQLNSLANSRRVLGAGTLLFGNIDPVGTLANGDEAAVRSAVAAAQSAGVDAVWPGCDLVPLTPLPNLYAFVDASHRV